MHTRLLQEASVEQLRSFLQKQFDELKTSNYEMYKELETELYVEMYGYHFNEYMLDKALSKMHNEDGTKGKHWTLEQTNSVASQYNVVFDKFNQYDFNYVMNMMYSDYYGVVGNDLKTYVNMSKRFLDDKDVMDSGEKALKYYLEIVC